MSIGYVTFTYNMSNSVNQYENAVLQGARLQKRINTDWDCHCNLKLSVEVQKHYILSVNVIHDYKIADNIENWKCTNTNITKW